MAKSPSTFNILSGKENIDNQPKVVQEIKEELLKSLEKKGNYMNRNAFAKHLKNNRFQNGMDNINKGIPEGKIKVFWGKEVLIDKIKYKDIFDTYEKTITEPESEEKNKKLEKIDRELSERMILDSGNMIQFVSTEKYEESISAEEESKKVYEKLKDLGDYKGKIERAMKILGTEKHFVIKWTEEQLEMLKIVADKITEDMIENEWAKSIHVLNPDDEWDSEEAKKNKIKKDQEDEVKKQKKLLNDETVDESKENIDKNLLVNRDNIAEFIRKAREGNTFPTWKISVRNWAYVNIEDQEHYKTFKTKYIKANNDYAKTKKLDTEFAELIILNNPKNETDKEKKYYIQINNDEPGQDVKSEEELKKESLRCEKSLKKLWYNVKYIRYEDESGKIYHIVKYTDEIIPIPVPEEGLELNAVISDMGTDVHRERVSLETEEELRDEYKWLARYNMPRRAYLFLSRGAKRKRKIKAKMNALSGKAFSGNASLDDKTENASDRHELELQHKLDKVEKANTVTLQNAQVNDLCKEYLKGAITEAQFQKDFNTVIEADANIQKVLKDEKITHIGTNVLEKLKQQKASWDLINKIDTEFTKRVVNTTLVNKEITQYIKDYQKNPEFMKEYKDFVDGVPWAKNKLEKYFNHQKSIMMMKATNFKMNIDILVKGKSAYQIDNKDRQKGRAYKVGNVLDKLPRWAQTAWFIGISVGTGILTGWLGAVAAAAITTGVSASMVGGMNALKKWTHYTKEQNTHEKNVVTDYRNEQAKIKERQNRALNGKRYQWKTYKAKRQLALYDQSTQEDINISHDISDTITDLASQVEPLDAKEENYMKKNLIQGRARLKYYREIGHNFLASNDKEKIEQDMKRLEKSIILWVGKLGKTLPDIQTMQATDDTGANLTYTTVQKDLESSYNKSLIQFKRERRVLSAKYGIGTAAMSAGMSIGMQYLMGTGIFGGEKVPWVVGQETTVNAHEHFKLGNAELLDTGTRNEIYNTGVNTLKDVRVVDGSTITINYGAGTDATQVIAGRLTPAIYEAKIQSVVDHINSMSLGSTAKTELLDHIQRRVREQWWTTQDFVNNALHGMRSVELLEQTAQAISDSWRENLNFVIHYDPSLDVVGTGIKNEAERIVNASFVVQTPSIPGTDPSNRGRFLQFPLFFNTFKDRVKGKTPEEPKPITPDEPKKPRPTPDIPKKPEDDIPVDPKKKS